MDNRATDESVIAGDRAIHVGFHVDMLGVAKIESWEYGEYCGPL